MIRITQKGPKVQAVQHYNQPLPTRRIRIVGTGSEVPDDGFQPMTYVGTFKKGAFMWHVFDGGEANR